MASPFGKNTGPILKCKRDTHDLSFQSNATYKFGYLYPAFVKEASAGDSWHIDPSFGLRFLPTYFPLQTKINAKMDFFYVRYRNLWKDWKNYRYGTGNPSSHPVLSQSETKEQSKTGSLGDYMGLPSTLVGENVILRSNLFLGGTSYSQAPNYVSGYDLFYNERVYINGQSGNEIYSYWKCYLPLDAFDNSQVVSDYLSSPQYSVTNSQLRGQSVINGNYVLEISSPPQFANVQFYLLTTNCYDISNHRINLSDSYSVVGPSQFIVSGNKLLVPRSIIDSQSVDTRYLLLCFNPDGDLDRYSNSNSTFDVVNHNVNPYKVVEATSVFSNIPYAVSAFPFRAYEQIYNSFYRDNRNNPFMVNGVYDPNVFLPNTDGGVDTYQYRLHKRNWEQDFLTSAMPSPQYGNAPLVGVTSSGVATFQLDDGTEVQSQLEYDENDKVVGFSTTSSNEANRTLIDLASSGISINDLRGVNSMQKYLELHWRRGLRYKDQMLSHRGIDIAEAVLDMPEFIGSVVQRIDVSQINQTAPSSEDPLGSYAGQLSAVGGGHKMTKYCDEDGLIIGILSIVPVPAYSQLLPKHFTKVNDPLEYFDPSFRNLGMQAIPYREVCPLQAANQNIPLDSTFGYNRAWYDYLQSQDEIHGQFRTTLNNYVLARVFNAVPSLNPDFLTVDPESLNDVFSVSEVTLDDGTKVTLDTILGQLHFNVSCERQIPRYALPSLD